jgi:hypothetical protein
MTFYVYLIQCEHFVKVGISSDPVRRCANLADNGPFPLILRNSWAYPCRRTASFIESACHELLTEHGLHHKGEWFVTAERVLPVVEHVMGQYPIPMLPGQCSVWPENTSFRGD